jgi:hypothetical protein
MHIMPIMSCRLKKYKLYGQLCAGDTELKRDTCQVKMIFNLYIYRFFMLQL